MQGWSTSLDKGKSGSIFYNPISLYLMKTTGKTLASELSDNSIAYRQDTYRDYCEVQRRKCDRTVRLFAFI
uniref:Uncharacterized protein n=1 Tax=Anguilla anguilla TaxID=7936 RepID=A0A0E9W5J3_ANGAN